MNTSNKPTFIFFYDTYGSACGDLSYYRVDRRWSIARITAEAIRIGKLRGYTGAMLGNSFRNHPDKPTIIF